MFKRIYNSLSIRIPRFTQRGLVGAVIVGLLLLSSCSNTAKTTDGPGEVVIFVSLDRLFSKPILDAFQKKTGIKVKAQYDAEGSKTVGLVNRLILRKEKPEADLFWNNELGQTLVLKKQGILHPYQPKNAADIPDNMKDAAGWWTGFAARARVILYNTDLVKPEDAPTTLRHLTQPRFKNNVVIARPLFGTTFTHTAALFSNWGPDKTKSFFRALKENGVKVVPGNAMARNKVADGEVAVCLTDTDDANGALLKGKHVAMVYPDQDRLGTLIIPNTVALIKNGPNSENAKRLLEFLISAEVEAILAKGESAQMPVREGVAPFSDRFQLKSIKPMEVNWEHTAEQFDDVKEFVQSELTW